MTKRFFPIISLFFLIAGILFLLNIFALEMLSTVRAYVGGESLYSKGQKEAIYNLNLYISTHNKGYYDEFRKNLAIPLGDQKARLELEKDHTDTQIVYEGFSQGSNHADDFENLTVLFEYGSNSSLMKKAVDIWRMADQHINAIDSIGNKLFTLIESGEGSTTEIIGLEAELRTHNALLTVLENEFSAELGSAARDLKNKIILVSFIISVVLFIICAWIASVLFHKIRVSGERYQQLFDESLDAIFITAVDGTITEINGAGLKLLGVSSKAELVGERSSLVSFYQNREDRDALIDEIEKNGYIKEREFKLVSVHGEIYDLISTATVIKNEKREIIGYRGIIRDITEKRAAENQLIKKNVELEKINAELDRLVYTASHDLRSPLNSLLGLIMLAKEEKNQYEQASFFTMMERCVKNLNNYVTEIIGYSRNGRMEIVASSIDFEKMVDECLDNYKFLKETKKIRFIKEIKQGDLFNSDPNRILVLLNNLISNAIKYHDYSKKEQFIYIKVMVKEKIASITVKDNGYGIAEKHQTKIFDMFYTTSNTESGSGLGLFIVKEMVEKLKGKIALYSIYGTGTEFVIQLPELKEKRISVTQL